MTPMERFEGKYRITPSCWEWTARCDAKGYGEFYLRHGVKISAHRVSYMFYVGEIPKNLLVRHKCDNPRCVNPMHLEVGTHFDNIHDCIQRGRRNIQQGEKARNVKLSDQEVAQLRDLYASGLFSPGKLSRLYEISQSQAYRIVHCKSRELK